MRIRIAAVVVALGIVGALMPACSSGAGGALKGIMEVLPDDVSYFSYFDVEAMRTDRNYRDMYDKMRDDLGDSLLDDLGQYSRDVDSVAFAYSEDSYAYWGVITGDLDVDEFRYAMEENGYDEDDYRDVEVWSDGYEAYSLINNMIVFVDEEDEIRSAIRLADDSAGSMYDDEDYRDVLSRLPSGVYTVLGQDDYEEYRSYGISIGSSGDDDVLAFTACFKFSSERRAEDNMRDLEEEMERSFDLYGIDSSQSGEFITITGEIDIEDFYWEYYY